MLSQGIFANVNGENCIPIKAEIEFSISSDTVQFTSKSIGADTWDWDFGDSNSSDIENPSHVYSSEGSYFIWLNIANGCYTDTKLAQVTITKPTPTEIIEKENLTYSIYPNPTKGDFIIKASKIKENRMIIIKDVLGRNIKSQDWPNNTSSLDVKINNNKTGICYINIFSNNILINVYPIIIQP